MAQKSAKKKPKKADQPGVLGSLPATRPTRIGRARPVSDEGGATATKASSRATKPSGRATRSSARATKSSARATKSSPRATKPRATGTKARGAGTKAPRAATTTPPRPQQRRTAPPQSDGRRTEPPRGLELVTTGAQAAGELARIGLTVGGQVLKRAARRLPRP